jgi:hypothetical protein
MHLKFLFSFRLPKLTNLFFRIKELKKTYSLENEIDNTTASGVYRGGKNQDYSEIPLSNQILFEKLDYKTEYDQGTGTRESREPSPINEITHSTLIKSE